jgi:hypothetical protein
MINICMDTEAVEKSEAVIPQERKKTSISIDPDVWAEFRIRSMRDRIDVADALEAVMREWAERPVEAKDQEKIEIVLSSDDLRRLEEASEAKGYASVAHFARSVIEREAAGRPLDLDKVTAKEAELAIFVIEQCRGGEYKDFADMCMWMMARAKAKKK